MSNSPYVIEGTLENFDAQVLKASESVPVLVDFWAAWCNPCQMMMPIVTRLAEEYQGQFHLVKVNADEQQQLAGQYGVRSLPTLKLFHHGQVIEEVMGAQAEPALRQLLDKHIQKEADPKVLQAMQLAQQGELEAAKALLEQAHIDDPANSQLSLDLIRITVMMGDYLAAESMIANLPSEQKDSVETMALAAQITLTKIIQDSPEPVELEKNLANNADDLQNHYQLAAWQALEGNHEAALERLLLIMKKDRKWQDDAGRKGMLTVFELIGGEGELVGKYRRQMFNLLH